MKKLVWEPVDNITAYELAKCLPVFSSADSTEVGEYYSTLTNNVKRHWKEVELTEEEKNTVLSGDNTNTSQPRIENG